jgi:hypothetical protein
VTLLAQLEAELAQGYPPPWVPPPGWGIEHRPPHRVHLLRAAGHNASKTECVRGHPFTEENTIVRPSGRRRCRRCHLDYGRGLIW